MSRRKLWSAIPRRPTRRPEHRLLALSFDLDYQADTDALPALLALLERCGVQATFFSIGKLVRQDPEPYRGAVRAGHEIGNHTWSHPDNPVLNPDREFWHLSTDEMTEEIGRAQEAFERLLGVHATGFRTPHFKDAPRMMDALAHFDEVSYVSTALASRTPLGRPYFPTTTEAAGDQRLCFSSTNADENSSTLMIPLTPCPAHRWAPFDTWHALRRPSDPRPGPAHHDDLGAYHRLWQKMLRQAAPGGFASVYFDPMDVMRDAKTAAAFEQMLRGARRDGWTLAPLRTVERAWRAVLKTDAEPKAKQHA